MGEEMDYKYILQVIYDIINLQFTQTILIAIVTIGGVWFTQQSERKKWEKQREWEKRKLEIQLKKESIEYQFYLYKNVVDNFDMLIDFCIGGRQIERDQLLNYALLPNDIYEKMEKIRDAARQEKGVDMDKLTEFLIERLNDLRNEKEKILLEFNDNSN
jgi:hypothetical protein